MNLLLVPSAAAIFDTLRIDVSVLHTVPWWGNHWWPIRTEPVSLLRFEVEHGVETEREKYNQRCLAQAGKTKRLVRGEHDGLSDFFVPIVVAGKVEGVLITGPVSTTPISSAFVLERWRRMTGRQPHLADPEFLAFLDAALNVLVLNRDLLKAFEKVLENLALLIAGAPRDPLSHETYLLGQTLEEARVAEQMWQLVDGMLDERSPRFWRSASSRYEVARIGLKRMPDHLIVGLVQGMARDSDPVEDAIRYRQLQRGAVTLARRTGDVLSGRVGDHGIVLISASGGPQERRRQKVHDLVTRLSSMARQRFGLALHFGVSSLSETESAPRGYQNALGAAESALTQGIKLVTAERGASRPAHSLRHLRQELAAVVEQRPDQLSVRFERYVGAVASHCAYGIEPARAHLEVAFERVTERLVASGALDSKSFNVLRDALDRASGSAHTINDLFRAYQRAVADVSEAVQKPLPARQDRSLRGAVDFIHQHYTETITIKQVAKVAGFSSTYFSLLFKQRERVTFEAYVAALRLRRAKELLGGTVFNATRVAELSGYKSLTYFCRVFRKEVGLTPALYQKKMWEEAHKVREKPARRARR